MKWKKKGHIFKADGQFPWMNSHTTPIAAIHIAGIIRVYFATRSRIDSSGNYVSRSGYIDLNAANPKQIIYISEDPLLQLGGYGMFDEFGVMVTDVRAINNRILLYYAGWQRLGGGTAAYQVMLGLGVSNDGGASFRKYSAGPILGIDTIDPVSIGNVSVLEDDGVFRMYYTSITEWFIHGKKPTYEYIINYAESADGVNWKKTGLTAVGLANDCGVATPCAIKYKDQYHMWFGYRAKYNAEMNVGGYSIGYAHSQDGVSWQRDDSSVGIEQGTSGWDSEMVCYPSVLEVDGKLLMFYCGNGFGLSGFGYAELEEEA